MESELAKILPSPTENGESVRLESVEPEDVDPAKEAVVIEFEKSYVYDGKTYTEITLNFPRINNKQYGKIERDFHDLNPRLFAPMLSTCEAYLMVAAAVAADVPIGLIYTLEGIDARTVINLAFRAVGKTSDERKVRRAMKVIP
jgi:hypothetical protein